MESVSPREAAEAGEQLRALLDALGQVVVGQERVLHQLLVTFVAGGHALLEGVPGTAKTLSVMALAEALDLRSGRIQFTPDLMPSDVTGVEVLDPRDQRFEFRPGPLFAELLLADEINRAPAKTQSALLEAMQERGATVDGTRHALGPLFTVFATQNGIEFEGTYPLPEAQLDRFLLKVMVDYPEREFEVALLERHLSGFDSADPSTFGIRARLGSERAQQLRQLARRIHVAPSVVEYVADLVRATRVDPALELGASPRASVALLRAAQAAALIEGREYVVPDDVAELAIPVLRHRVLLAPEAEIDGVSSDERVRSALAEVPAPEVERAAAAGDAAEAE
jgi:MoxR-like ATPase